MGAPWRTRDRQGPWRTRNAGTVSAAAASFDPLVDITWYAAYFAEDPDWVAPANGAAVSQWDDGSGNGRHVAQGTAGDRPIFRSAYATLNSKPAVEFVSSDYLFLDIADLASPYTLVAIGHTAGGTGIERIIGNGTDAAAGGLGDTAAGAFNIRAGTSLPAGTADSTKHLFTGVVNGASGKLILDGTTIATGNTGTGALTHLSLGCGTDAGATPTNFLTGAIAFAGIYSGDITANGNWTSFKTWAAAHYSITIA